MCKSSQRTNCDGCGWSDHSARIMLSRGRRRVSLGQNNAVARETESMAMVFSEHHDERKAPLAKRKVVELHHVLRT